MSMAFGIVILLSLVTLVYGKSLFATYPFCEHINQNECITYMSTVKCVQFVWAIRSCCLHGIRWREIRCEIRKTWNSIKYFESDVSCLHVFNWINMWLLLSWSHLCEPLLFVSTRSAYTLYHALIIIIKLIQFNSTLKYASNFSDYFCCCQIVVEKSSTSILIDHVFCIKSTMHKSRSVPSSMQKNTFFSFSAKTQRCRTNDKLEQKHMVKFIFCTIN